MSVIVAPIRYGELTLEEQGMLFTMINDGYDGYNVNEFLDGLPDSEFLIRRVLNRLVKLEYIFNRDGRYFVNQKRLYDNSYYKMVVI